ncbi:MAG TPA: hypothetical protein VL793_13955, partial [Patescibacteria group bacterium]|nr:hypothetical protein [Patescibacteria group bacterium]
TSNQQGGIGRYFLAGGSLVSGELDMGFNSYPNVSSSAFEQSGGYHTNGSGIYIDNSHYKLSGGVLNSSSMILSGGEVSQSGGTNELGTLTMIFNSKSRYTFSGGQLDTDRAEINDGTFGDYGGTAKIRFLSLANGVWNEGSSGQQLGALRLGAGHSFINLSNPACILTFADSSSLSWNADGLLVIQNWSGSLYGGGLNRVIFGGSSVSLTRQQVGQLRFEDPAGLVPGTYPARILATGEIVPDTGEQLLPRIEVSLAATELSVRLRIEGDIGANYGIEASADLSHWVIWTNEVNATGTLLLQDSARTNLQQCFYRAVLISPR